MMLIIGNKRYSSWSLRPWLLMTHFQIPFQEKLIPLDQPQTAQEIAKFSPSGRVPALVDGGLVVWESLAIMEYLNDKFPDKKMWPQDLQKRAWARSVSNEMHAGFSNMRNHMPHDLHKKLNSFDAAKAQEDIQRIKRIWTQCLDLSGGPFLFGEFSIADAMYAPVVNRFISYGIPAEGWVQKYIQTLRELPAHRQWIEAAMAEKLEMPRYN